MFWFFFSLHLNRGKYFVKKRCDFIMNPVPKPLFEFLINKIFVFHLNTLIPLRSTQMFYFFSTKTYVFSSFRHFINWMLLKRCLYCLHILDPIKSLHSFNLSKPRLSRKTQQQQSHKLIKSFLYLFPAATLSFVILLCR